MYAPITTQAVCQVWPGLGVCFIESPTFGTIFALQLLNQELDMNKDNHVQQSASPFVVHMVELDLKCPIHVRRNTAGFTIMQTFPSHMLYRHVPYHMENSVFDLAKNISASRGTPLWRLLLDMFSFRSLLAVVWGAFSVTIKASNAKHHSVGFGVFSGRSFGAG